jgi:prophage maintenance system killer protein
MPLFENIRSIENIKLDAEWSETMSYLFSAKQGSLLIDLSDIEYLISGDVEIEATFIRNVIENNLYQQSMKALDAYNHVYTLKERTAEKPSVPSGHVLPTWRLHIDPSHQKFGPFAYNKGGSASQNEFSEKNNYLQNMLSADMYLEKALKESEGIVTFEMHAELYKHSMSGWSQKDNYSLRSNIATTCVGQFGHVESERVRDVLQRKPNGPSEFLDDKEIDVKKLEDDIKNGVYFSTSFRGYYQTSEEDLKSYLTERFKDYNENIRRSHDKENIITSIATLYQELESAHPYRDGNGRTNRALLNGLLKYHGLGFSMISDPAAAHFLTIRSLVVEIERGQAEYIEASRLNVLELSWVKQNEQLIEWEKKNGVTMEYSIELGDILNHRWDCVEQGKRALTRLINARNSFDESAVLPDEIIQRILPRLNQGIECLTVKIKDDLMNLRELINKSSFAYNEVKEVKEQRRNALLIYEQYIASLPSIKQVDALVKGVRFFKGLATPPDSPNDMTHCDSERNEQIGGQKPPGQ